MCHKTFVAKLKTQVPIMALTSSLCAVAEMVEGSLVNLIYYQLN